MNFIFLMDPLDTVVMKKDTTFILMLGAHRKGHKIYYLPQGHTTLSQGHIFFRVTQVIPQLVAEKPFLIKKVLNLREHEVDAVFIRTDPPFNQQYLIDTWLLDRLPQHIPVINSPNGIRTVNEKLWATQFTKLIPSTLVSRHKENFLRFLQKEKDVIAKPTDGHGGKGVFRIKLGDKNTNVILETLTERWHKEIILQKYIPAAEKGDKRIILLNGEPLGAMLRLHAEGDYRNNIFAGGKANPATISKRDGEIIRVLRPHLAALGLYFVGIDILGDYLIEVNVTSPTCLQEINHFNHKHLENQVIEFTEQLVNRYKPARKG